MNLVTNIRTKPPIIAYCAANLGQREESRIKDFADTFEAQVIVATEIDSHLDVAFGLTVASLIILEWRAAEAEIKFLSGFRKRFPFSPVLVAAATDNQAARHKAFLLEADNYLDVNAPRQELLLKASRLKALACRYGMEEAPLQFGTTCIWPEAELVMCDGHRIQLSRLELSLLTQLARNSPLPVSREALEHRTFGLKHDPGTNVVAVHIHRLRHKIDEGAKLIRTIPGQGYCLVSQ